MQVLLAKAIEFAVDAHKGQLDKQGYPYILHPLRVMLSFNKDKTDERIVAILHDVVEDCDVFVEDLEVLGLTDVQINAIIAITKDFYEVETLKEYWERVRKDELAKRVKLNDIADNTLPERIRGLDPLLASYFQKKYAKALAYLTEE